jgi:transposase
MSRYSLDIRKKVVTAYHLGNTSIRKLAQQFLISPATVHKLLKQYRDTQDLRAQKPRRNKPGKLEQNREFIIEIVQNPPD